MQQFLSLVCFLVFGTLTFAQDSAASDQVSSTSEVTWTLGQIAFDRAFPYQKRDFFTKKIKATLGRAGTVIQRPGMGQLEISTLSSTDQVNTGMKNMTTARIELTITAKENIDGTVMASIQRTITGSGDNAQAAFQQAVRNFRSNSKLKKFFTEASENYKTNIAENCERYLTQANRHSQTGNFSQALSLLLATPAEGACGEKADAKLIEVYRAFQQKKCNEFVLKAQGQAASGQYVRAATTLGYISGDAPCITEAKAVAATIRSNSKEDLFAKLDALEAAWANPLSGASLRSAVLLYLKN